MLNASLMKKSAAGLVANGIDNPQGDFLDHVTVQKTRHIENQRAVIDKIEQASYWHHGMVRRSPPVPIPNIRLRESPHIDGRSDDELGIVQATVSGLPETYLQFVILAPQVPWIEPAYGRERRTAHGHVGGQQAKRMRRVGPERSRTIIGQSEWTPM
jgi:hypothetical protein